MTFLLLLPSFLSSLLLLLHCFRSGNLPVAVVCLGMMALTFVPRRWAWVLLQLSLWLGAAEWIRTTVLLVQERLELGAPYTRLAIILGAVAAVTALSALALRTARARRHFGYAPQA